MSDGFSSQARSRDSDQCVSHAKQTPLNCYWDNVTIACKKKIIFCKSQPRREASEWLSADGKKFRDYFGFRSPCGAFPKQYLERNMSKNSTKISVLRVVA